METKIPRMKPTNEVQTLEIGAEFLQNRVARGDVPNVIPGDNRGLKTVLNLSQMKVFENEGSLSGHGQESR